MRHDGERSERRRAVPDAVVICLFVLGAFTYWFAVADRSVVFLYGATGDGLAEARPFDRVTSSRYWMAGFLTAGTVTVAYTGVHWLLGRLAGRWGLRSRPPSGTLVWAWCALPLGAGIPLITMTTNTPTLPPVSAAACTATTLAGLALGLRAAAWAAERPLDLAWLLADGAALLPTLLLLRVLELPGRGVGVPGGSALRLAVGAVGVTVVWLLLMTGLRAWRGTPVPAAGHLLGAALGECYLGFPVLHFLLSERRNHYVTASENLFAHSLRLQLLTFLTAMTLAAGVTGLRRKVSGSPRVRVTAGDQGPAIPADAVDRSGEPRARYSERSGAGCSERSRWSPI